MNFHFQFGATRHDAAGNLDPSFGTGGIATTEPRRQRRQGATTPRCSPTAGSWPSARPTPPDWGTSTSASCATPPTATPTPSFGSAGVVTTDITGRDDVANAVAVQPDGKIVVAGVAETAPGQLRFRARALQPRRDARPQLRRRRHRHHRPRHLRRRHHDIAIQPDGKIVVVGATDQNVALARYLPDGTLDPTFGNAGTVIGGIGTNEVNGVAITPGGTILIAGTGGGPKGTRPDRRQLRPQRQAEPRVRHSSASPRPTSAAGTTPATISSWTPTATSSSSAARRAPPCSDMALVRFKPDGTLDTSLTADFNGIGDFGHALAIDSQGRIVAAGSAGDQFGLIRANL